MYTQSGDFVSLGYTRPSAGLNRIELYGDGSSGANYVFHQPGDTGTLGTVYLNEANATLDFSDFTSDMTFDLGNTAAQQVSDQLNLTLAANGAASYLATGSGDNTFVFEPTAISVTLAANPSAVSNTLDFSAFPSTAPITLDIGSTAVQDLRGDGSVMLALTSASAIDNVVGTAGNDVLIGKSADNQLTSDGGNDVLYAAGVVTLSGTDAGDNMTVDTTALNGHTYVRANGHTLAGVLASSVNEIDVDGGQGNNTIDLSAVTAAVFNSLDHVKITVGHGSNTVHGSQLADEIFAGDGVNWLYGNDGDDLIYAGNGNNTIDGGAGADNLNAGSGNNTISGGAGDNIVNAVGGTNTIDAGTGNNLVNGQPTNHAPTIGAQDGSGGPVDLAGTDGTGTVAWYLAADDQDQSAELAISVVSDQTDDSVPLSIVETSLNHWTVTATMTEQDVQHTRKVTLRATDAGGLTADVDLYAETRDSTDAEDLGPLNWPVVAENKWIAVPEDGHLIANNANRDFVPWYDPPSSEGTYESHYEVELIDPPQHAAQWSFNTSDGSFVYTPEDGWSGEDYFTYRVVDRIDPFTVEGVSDKAKVILSKPFMEVEKIEHNSPSGDHLTQDEKVDYDNHSAQGAYLPLYSSDDNAQGQAFTLTGERSTLLPIVLKAYNSSFPGIYSISSGQNLQLYWDPQGKFPVQVGYFYAGVDTTLFVKGIATGHQDLRVYWTNVFHSNTDASKTTVFSWEGPRDVPWNSIYTYSATGGAIDQAPRWVDGIHSTLKSNGPEGTGVDTAKYQWDVNLPIVGSASYRAAEGYTWDMDVNVVRVDVSPPKVALAFAPAGGAPIDAGNHVYSSAVMGPTLSKVIDSKTEDGHAGLKWRATVTLTGPNGGRGIDKIETGFIQTITSITKRGHYTDSKILKSTLEDRTDMHDGDPDSWYDAEDDGYFKGKFFTDTYSIEHYNETLKGGKYSREIFGEDSPFADIPLTSEKHEVIDVANDHPLVSIELVYKFTLDISSRTTDDTVNDEGARIFTRMATADWEFNGTSRSAPDGIGPGPDYTWNRAFSARIAAPNAWTIKTDGSTSLLPANQFKSEELNQDFVQP